MAAWRGAGGKRGRAQCRVGDAHGAGAGCAIGNVSGAHDQALLDRQALALLALWPLEALGSLEALRLKSVKRGRVVCKRTGATLATCLSLYHPAQPRVHAHLRALRAWLPRFARLACKY